MKCILSVLLMWAVVAHAGEAPSFADPNYLVGGKIVKLDATDGYLAPGPLTLDPGAVSDGPIAYHWLRDGKALPGKTSPKLAFATITKADAGEYSVRISNRYGKATSGKYYLVVVGAKTSDFVSFGDKETKNVQVRNVWGPASFVWSSDGHDAGLGHGPSAIVYSAGGYNPWTLTVGVVVAVPGYQTDPVIAAEFSMGAVTIEDLSRLDSNLLVGQPLNFSLLAGTEASLKWLDAPPGLKVVPPSDQSYGAWTLAGAPTKAGFFQSTLVISTKGATTRLAKGFIVRPYFPPFPGVGTYAPWFEGTLTGGGKAVGSFNVALTNFQAFSGVLMLGGKRVPFSGRIGPSSKVYGYDASLPLPDAGKGIVLTVTLSDSMLTVTLTKPDGSVVASGSAVGSSWNTHSMPASWIGHYHAIFRSLNTDAFALATLDIRPNGRAALVATLSDGTVVSHHGIMADDGSMLLYTALYRSGAGYLAGQVSVTTWWSSGLDWSRPPATQLGVTDKTPTMFRSGLSATITSDHWSRYRPARSFEPFLGLPDGDNNAELEFGTNFAQPLSLPRRVTIARNGSVTAPGGYLFKLGIDPVKGTASGRVGVESIGGHSFNSVPLKGLVVGAHAGAPSAQVFVMGVATVRSLVPEFPEALAPLLISSVATTLNPAPFLRISSEADQILRSSVTVVEGQSAHLQAGPAVRPGDIVRWRAADELNSENFVPDAYGNLEWLHCDSTFEGAIIQAIVVGTRQLVAEYRIHVVTAFKLAIDSMILDQQVPVHVVLPANAVDNQLSAIGLPPGLRLSQEMIDDGSGSGTLVKTWALVGAPPQEGSWVATFTMSNAAGVSTQRVPIAVMPVLNWTETGIFANPERVTGMYTGVFYPGALLTEPAVSMPQGGKIVVNFTRSGNFTGVLETIGSKQAFTGVLDGFADMSSGQPTLRSGHAKLAPLPGIAHPVLTVSPGRFCDITDSDTPGIGTGSLLTRAMPMVPQRINALLNSQEFDPSPPALIVATASGGPNINIVIRQGGKAITFSTLNTDSFSFWAVSPSSPNTALTGQLIPGFPGFGSLTSIIPMTDDAGTSYPYVTLSGEGSSWTPPLPGNLLFDLPLAIDNAQLDATPITLSPGRYNYAFNGLPSDDGPANWQINIDRKTGTFTATRTTTATLHYFGLFFPDLHKAVGIDWHPPDTISASPVLMEIKPNE